MFSARSEQPSPDSSLTFYSANSRSGADIAELLKTATPPTWIKIQADGTAFLEEPNRRSLMNAYGVEMDDLSALKRTSDVHTVDLRWRMKSLIVILNHIRVIITGGFVLMYVRGKQNANEAALPAAPSVEEDKVGEQQIQSFAEKLQQVALKATTQSQQAAASAEDPAETDHAGCNWRRQAAIFAWAETKLVKSLPFELRALDLALAQAVDHQRTQTAELEKEIPVALDALRLRYMPKNQMTMNSLKERLEVLVENVKMTGNMVEKVLGGEDAARFTLTLREAAAEKIAQLWNKRQMISRTDMPHAVKAEALLETRKCLEQATETLRTQDTELRKIATTFSHEHMSVVKGISHRLQLLESTVRRGEEEVKLKLDYERNELIGWTLLVSSGALLTALVSAIAGLFGMNLKNGMEETKSFLIVASVMGGTLGVLLLVALVLFRFRGCIQSAWVKWVKRQRPQPSNARATR